MTRARTMSLTCEMASAKTRAALVGEDGAAVLVVLWHLEALSAPISHALGHILDHVPRRAGPLAVAATWTPGTVRRRGDLDLVPEAAVTHAVALDEPDPAGAIRALAPAGEDRIIEVDFAGNVDLDAAVAKNQAVIAAYATHQDRPSFAFWPMLFDNVTIRLLGSDDFPASAKQQAIADLTAARDGALHILVDMLLPLDQTARAHDRVDEGPRGRVLLAVPRVIPPSVTSRAHLMSAEGMKLLASLMLMPAGQRAARGPGRE
jgi:hypothetical protein